MQLPKLNKFSLSLNTILTLAAVIFIAAEVYYAWAHLYQNLVSTPIAEESTDIVRLNSKTYQSIVKMLDDRESFLTNNPIPTNSNPFK